MPKVAALRYNTWFTLPLLAWALTGGIIMIFFSRSDLFFSINTHYSDSANIAFYYITWMGQGEVIIPVLFAMMLIPAYRHRWYLLQAAMCNLVPFIIQQGLKSAFDRPRPRLLYYDRPTVHFMPDWPVLLSRSFPSGHSTGAFSFFCFLSLVLPARYRGLGLLFFLLALAVCYSRIYLAAHFYEDIYAGSLLGGFLTLLVFNIMNTYKSRLYKKETFF